MMEFANQQLIYVLALYGLVVLLPYFVMCFAPIKSLAQWRMNLGVKKKSSGHEFLSTLTSFIILYGTFLLSGYLQDRGILIFREDLPPWFYLLSFPLVVLIHDAYFYWTHYLMHKSKFFYQFHKAHHLNSDATPLDVFAFHPVEALIHFIYFLAYPLLIPTSLPVIQFMFVWMLFCNSAGHLPYEFYPKFLYDYPVLRQFNSATHHQMHHKFYTSNFSIYYNWWDRWMGTNHREYFATYKKIKENQSSFIPPG